VFSSYPIAIIEQKLQFCAEKSLLGVPTCPKTAKNWPQSDFSALFLHSVIGDNCLTLESEGSRALICSLKIRRWWLMR
jgi:hypothetical protein